MTFQKIIEGISLKYSISSISTVKDQQISDLAFIDEIHECNQVNTLYFGYDRQISSLSSMPAQCILATTLNYQLPESENTAVAYVSEDRLFAIFNHVKILLDASNKGPGLFEELTALADRSHSIDQVIDTAALRLGNSLIFCDMNFKVIASSTSIPVIDPIWIENTRQGYCSYEFIREIRSLKSIQNAAYTTAPVEVTCNRSPYRKLSSKVFHNQKQIGFLLLIEGESPFQSNPSDMLSTVSHVVSYTLAYYNSSLLEATNFYSELLYDMLIGAPSKNILPRLKTLQFPEHMIVLFIRPTRYMGQQHLVDFTTKHLKLYLPGAHAVYHKKGVVAVIPYPEDYSAHGEKISLLEDFCQKEHFKIGISNVFSNIENYVSYYEQAQSAMELGQKLESQHTVYRYEEYQVFDLFSKVKPHDSLGRFCHPALGILRQYDHKNHAELYKTLCVFIDQGCNIKLTAEILYIHRNSLVYRLERISKICQLDFTENHTIFLLRLSFLIDRYNELNSTSEWA